MQGWYSSLSPSHPPSFSSDAEQRCHDSCQKAVHYAPDSPEAHQLLASCLLSMNRHEVGRGVGREWGGWKRGGKEGGEEVKGSGEGGGGRGDGNTFSLWT